MDFIKYAEKLQSLEYFINSQTGITVSRLSEKLDVSERTVLRMVENLRIRGVNVRYCKRRRTYFIE